MGSRGCGGDGRHGGAGPRRERSRSTRPRRGSAKGEEVTLVGTGRSGWIDGVHYLAVYIEFTGVFTPEGGGEPEFEGEQNFYGNRGNLVHPEAIRCDVHFEETIPGEGTFVADGYVIAIPVN